MGSEQRRSRILTTSRLGALIVLLGLSALAQDASKTAISPWRAVVMGTHGMVAAEHPLQARAAVKVLENGGNAIDAAVAAYYMTGVTEQHQSGLGGDAVILAYLAGPKKLVFINGTGRAPSLATPEFYRSKLGGIPLDGPYSSTIPGAVSAFDLALKKYGTKQYAELIQDAIECAEKGHPITVFAARNHAFGRPLLLRYPYSARTLLKNSEPFEPGELFVQPDLARTLRTIVQEGPSSFYRGSLAKLTVATYKKYDGLISLNDLAAYEADESDPVHVDYKGYSVYQTGANTSGIVQLMAMNIVKGFDLKALGHNSPDYLHVLVEALKLAFADRQEYVSDPQRRAIPVKAMLSDEYAASRRKLIHMDRAIRGVPPPGDPEKRLAIRAGRSISYENTKQAVNHSYAGPSDHGETSSISIADKYGNLVSATHSVNGTFGSGIVIEGGGYLLNNRLPYFSLKPEDVNVLAPGKRNMSTICSALAMKDGKPVMAWNTPGGDNQPQALLQAFLNIIEFGMNQQQALEEPTVTTANLYPSMYPHEPGHTLIVPKALADRVGPALAAKGHTVDVGFLQQPYFQQTAGVGAVKMVVIDPRTGVMKGSVSPAKDNYVSGW